MDNDAHIEGLLFEVGKNYKRKGQFQTFFKHHAAILSNGKLAVDSADSVHFITNKVQDDHDFDNPCPPTQQRVAEYENLDEAVALLTSILRGRARCEEIDEVNTAASTAGLAGLSADNSIKALLTALGKYGGADAKSLSSLVSTLEAVADPNKTKAGDKDKKPPLDIPRGPDNKPIAWVEGMALCCCGVGGLPR